MKPNKLRVPLNTLSVEEEKESPKDLNAQQKKEDKENISLYSNVEQSRFKNKIPQGFKGSLQSLK